MQPKTTGFLVKSAFGIAVSCLLGAIVKLENRVEDRIEEHYEKKQEQDPNV